VNTEADAAILGDIRALHEIVDPPPAEVRRAAKEAFAWRDVDAALAALTADSLLDSAGVRSTAGARLLTFVCDRLTVEVEVIPHAGRNRLLGQLIPIAPGSITAGGPGLEVVASIDAVGCFRFDDLPSGPLRLHHRPAGGGAVATSWIII
jgi:hypothetical protein